MATLAAATLRLMVDEPAVSDLRLARDLRFKATVLGEQDLPKSTTAFVEI